ELAAPELVVAGVQLQCVGDLLLDVRPAGGRVRVLIDDDLDGVLGDAHRRGAAVVAVRRPRYDAVGRGRGREANPLGGRGGVRVGEGRGGADAGCGSCGRRTGRRRGRLRGRTAGL